MLSAFLNFKIIEETFTRLYRNYIIQVFKEPLFRFSIIYYLDVFIETIERPFLKTFKMWGPLETRKKETLNTKGSYRYGTRNCLPLQEVKIGLLIQFLH
jgi:hypothetical protein